MRRYRGNEQVEVGLYFNPRQLSFKSMDEAGRLPGTEADVYREVPTLALLVVGPLLGLAYVVFLPFLGVAMVTWLLGVKAAQVGGSVAREAVHVLRPAWQPTLAFFSRPTAAKAEPPASDEWAEAVRKKVESTNRRAPSSR